MNGSPSRELLLQDLPTRLELTDHEIHIWCADLVWPTHWMQQFRQWLSPDEQIRASRFRFDQHRHRFIAGRGILRSILACYVGLAPVDLQFSYSPQGKPSLTTFVNLNSAVSFNLSHSNTLALYAVTSNRPIGIDLEHLRPIQEIDQLTKRFFSPQEHAAIRKLPPQEQQAAFFRLWTCKEAYLKATGEGLSGLRHVEISIESMSSSVAVNIQDHADVLSQWTIVQLHPHPDYVAALAVEGKNWQLVNYALRSS